MISAELRPVNNFSTISLTDVEFQIDASNVGGVSNVVFHLIDASQTNNLVDFLNNYDSSRAEITTQPATGVLDNHLKTPSTGPTNIGGSIFSTSAIVGNDVTAGQEFYLIAIVYSKGDLPSTNIVNSFIFGPYEVTETPGIEESCCSLDIVSDFFDYNSQFTTNCFKPTVKERIKHRLTICGGEFASECLVNLGLPLEKVNEWLNYVTTIDLRILREVVDYPAAGQTTSFIYENYSIIRDPAFPGGYNLNGQKFLTASDPGAIGDNPCITTEFLTRVRYEDQIQPTFVQVANNSTPFSRTGVGSLAPVYIAANNVSFDWAGQDIIFEYQINFDVSSLLGVPFTFTQVFRPKINPFDFEDKESPRGLSDIQFFAPDGPNEEPGTELFTAFCAETYPFIWVKTTKITNDDLNLIATVDFLPYNANNLEEEESYNSPFLSNLTSSYVFDVDILFDPVTNEAFFKLDLTQFGPGTYQICSIALTFIK